MLRNGGGDAPPERHFVALLFVDLCGSTHLAEREGPEPLAHVLQQLFAICREAVTQHRGRVVRVVGDGALAVFGYPYPAEDDALRAAEAALEIHRRFEGIAFDASLSFDRPPRLHSGLHCGLVLVIPSGEQPGQVELVGDAANVAARIAALAEEGAVLADLDSLGPHAGYFELEHQPPVRLAGRAVPVNVARLLRRADVHRRLDGAARIGVTPFIGRRPLLAGLWERLARPNADPSRRVYLEGPAGIGKSRLLDELAASPHAAGFLRWRGACNESSRSVELQPFIEMARTHASAELAGGAEGAAGAGLRALSQALISAAVGHRLLLLLDDWHWADDASRALLELLLSRSDDTLAVLAVRPAPQELPGAATRLTLAPFDEGETAIAMARWTEHADPYTVAAIHRYAGGVPLFVEELGRYAASRRLLADGAVTPGMSNWLAALVASRVASLPLFEQRVLRTAAVFGHSCPISLLRDVGQWHGQDLPLRALVEADFVDIDGHQLRFKHGLTRDAVYQTVGLAERQQVHRAVADALLSADSDAYGPHLTESLAFHCRAAQLWDRAAAAAGAAVDRAAAVHAMDVVRRQAQVALDCLERLGLENTERAAMWCERLHQLGMAIIFDLLAVPVVLPLFERGVEVARRIGRPDLLARSLYWLGYLSHGHGRPHRAVECCRQALTVAAAADDAPLAAQLGATLGQALAAACKYDEALRWMDDSLHTKQLRAKPRSSVAVGSAFTLSCKAAVLADRGSFDDARSLLDEAEALVHGSSHPVVISVRNWTAVVLVWQGCWAEALDVTTDCIRRAETAHALLPLAIAHACEGYARWRGMGDVAGVEQIERAVAWLDQRRGRFFRSIYDGWLVEIAVEQGRHSDARRHAAKLLHHARDGEALGLPTAYRALELAAIHGKPLGAKPTRYLARAEQLAADRASRREMALNALCHATLCARGGADASAHDWAIAAQREFAAMGMHWHAAQAAAIH